MGVSLVLQVFVVPLLLLSIAEYALWAVARVYNMLLCLTYDVILLRYYCPID